MERAKLQHNYLRYNNGAFGRKKKQPSKPLQKRPVGRPSSYNEGFANMAYELRLLGASQEAIGRVLGVDDNTIARWRATIPEFREAYEEAGMLADARVARSLYHRANGYSHRAEKIHFDKFGQDHRAEYVEHYPPDTRAAEIWLTNRQPKLWKPLAKVDVNLPDGMGQKPPTIQINVVAAAATNVVNREGS